MNKHKRYPPEVRERAVRLVLEHQENYHSEWAALTSIAGKIGCTAETLRKWVRRAEVDQGKRAGPTSTERERIREVERENRELKRANEILHKAPAFFDLAETIIGLYKTEVIRTRGPWKTMDDVEYATLEWGPTGSTIIACWRPSAMCHRLSMKRCTMMSLTGHAKRHDSN